MFYIWLDAGTGSSSNSAVVVSFGVWGYCVSNIVVQ